MPKKRPKRRKIVLVAHDGHPHGAQYLALNLARTFSSDLGFDVDLVALGGGLLVEQYKNWATVHELDGVEPRGPEAKRLAKKLIESGHEVAICNTTVSGLFLQTLSEAGLRCVSLVHELKSVILDNKLEQHAQTIAQLADTVVFPAEQVRQSFDEIARLDMDKTLIRPQGLYKNNQYVAQQSSAQLKLRESLGLKRHSRIVLGVGFLDYRKGVDLFVETALKVCAEKPDCYFVWIGHWEVNMERQIHQRLEGHALAGHLIFPGRQDDTDLFYAGADLFTLTSREDPYPTTVMEALEVGVPVIGFKGAGGCDSLISEGCGELVPMEDVVGLAKAIERLLDDPVRIADIGARGRQVVRERFSFRHYLFDLLDFAGAPLKKVSAIVPNYNYARHLKQRLTSIFEQTYPVYEIIVLDDASSDDSVGVIEELLATSKIDSRLVINEVNSGSVFRQWRKGVELAKGEFIWICEADDFADSEFLERSLGKLAEPDVVMSYTQSRQVDEEGKVIDGDYLGYTNEVSLTKWKQDYVSEGKDELSDTICIKNTIPNVSAVVFRKYMLQRALEKHRHQLQKLKIAGDWLIYGELLRAGRLGFVAEPLNSHRRHDDSVTISTENNVRHMAEILFMQDWFEQVVTPSRSARIKATQFAAHAYEYLGLANTEFPEPEAHPGILQWLEDLRETQ